MSGLTVTVGALCFLGVLIIAAAALFLGREMRAEGQAKLGDRDVRVVVEVPGRATARQLPEDPSGHARAR